MAEYLVLIYQQETDYDPNSPMMAEHAAFGEKHGKALRGGNALQPVATATTIRADGTVTDGAFAETKEALGGYYLIEAADLDEALSIAKDVPAPLGGVEVRPIRTFE